jgi:SNF2 family DNA or RNA helicase
MDRIIKEKCKNCGKVATEVSSRPVGMKSVGNKKTQYIEHKLACGHIWLEKAISEIDVYDITSEDGRTLFDYQKDSVKFSETSNFRCLIAHEMGLGKTVISLASLKLHSKDLCPALIICKSGLKMQWFTEVVRWIGESHCPQLINTSRDVPYWDMFKVFIVSFDLLNNCKWKNDVRDGKTPIKTIIIDECQQIKNTASNRTQAARDVSRGAKHIVALSGTPLKNRASEYFTILNILKPERFHEETAFLSKYIFTYNDNSTGRIVKGGLRPGAVEQFREDTKDFVIRYLREDVMPQLPKVFRMYNYHELGESIQQSYLDAYDEFADAYDAADGNVGKRSGSEGEGNILGKLAKMRHIAGQAKIKPAVEYAKEFLTNTDLKLAIFAHHQDVQTIIHSQLTEWMLKEGMKAPLTYLGAGQDAASKWKSQQEFCDPNGGRIMTISMLAGGEGLNLQAACGDCLMVERQWNPANEEQCEARFPRPGSKFEKVNATYLVALESIDEWFAQIIEKKRAMFAQVMDGKDVAWSETNIMQQLADEVRRRGRPLWAA